MKRDLTRRSAGLAARVGQWSARAAAAACLVLVSAALLAATASAVPTSSSSFAGLDTPAGGMQPTGLATDESTGDVYVMDPANDVVNRFNADGTYLSQLSGAGTPAGTLGLRAVRDDIAVDNSGGPTQGYVYVVGDQDGGPGILTAFDAGGALRWQVAMPVGGGNDLCGVAVDADGRLWLADGNVGVQQRLVSDGTPTGSMYADILPLCASAFDAANVFYAIYLPGATVQFSPTVGGSPAFPDFNPDIDVATDSSNNDVYIDAGGQINAYDSSLNSLFSFGSGTLTGVTVDGAHGTIFVSNIDIPTRVEIWDRNSGSPKPYVRAQSPTGVSGTDATLNARVNPAGASTDCHFEYVSDTQFQIDGYASATSVNCDQNSIAAGSSDVDVTRAITGLTAHATYHYRIVATNGAGTVRGADNTFEAIPTYPLTVTVDGTGNGRVDADLGAISNCNRSGGACSDDYIENTVVRLTATPTHSTISWSGGGCSGSGTFCDVTMDAAKNVTVTFTQIRHTLSVAKSGTGTGTVTSSPAGIDCGATCDLSGNEGDGYTLTARAGDHSTFDGWSGCTSVSGDRCTVALNADVRVTARFTKITHTVTVTKAGTGSGTVTSSPAGIDCGATCAAAFDEGATVTLTATAASGSTFAGWSGAGCSGTGTCQVSVSAAATVTATFTKDPVVGQPGPGTLTLDSHSASVKGGKASIRVSCTGDTGSSCDQTLTFTAKVKRGKKKRTITVGTLAVSLRAGESATLSLKLSGSAKSALAKKPHKLAASSDAGKVTLKQAVKRKKHKK